MRTLLPVLLGSSLLGAATVPREPPAVPIAPAAELAPGDVAPLFSLTGSDGQTYRLEDYTGKKAVVLAWFARAFSGG